MEAEEFTRWEAVTTNFGMLNLCMIGIAAVVLLLSVIIKRQKISYKKAVLFLIIGLMPYVWYFLLANHSYLHWWFTYRLQAITVVCLLFVFCDGNSKDRKSPFFTP